MNAVTAPSRRHLRFAIVAVLLACAPCIAAADDAKATPPTPSITRRYRDGETITYEMTASNQDRVKLLRYCAVATAVARKGKDAFVEDVAWSRLVVNDKEIALPADGAGTHQLVSLAPDYQWTAPDVAKTPPSLIGPVLDLMTVYVDLWLATKQGKLAHVGDHFVMPRSSANSWADGTWVTLGEDAIDFDVTLAAVDEKARTATVIVRHVPPAKPEIRLPAEWMKAPVADTANNWVQVQRRGANGERFLAAVGKETFDVELRVSLDDGRILSAHLDNLVDVLERDCRNAALDDPGEPMRYRIHRVIDVVARAP